MVFANRTQKLVSYLKQPEAITFSVGAESADAIEVTISAMADFDGNSITELTPMLIWLSSAAGGAAATTADAIAFDGTNSANITVTAAVGGGMAILKTGAVFTVTEAGGDVDYYLNVANMHGEVFSSAILDFSA